MFRPRLLLLACLPFLALPNVARAQYAMSLSEMIVAIQIGDFYPDLERLDGVIHVYVERVSRMAGIRLSGKVLDATLARRERQLDYLRHVLGDNDEVRKALARHNEALEDVILLTTTGDHGATIYVDDR